MVKVVHMSKITPGSIMASCRIAEWIKSQTDGVLIDNEDSCSAHSGGTVILVNSPTAFCDWIDEVVRLALSAERLIWVMNDYTLYPPTQLRDALGMRKMELFTTVPMLSTRLSQRWTYRNLPDVGKYVNWNLLTYNPQPRVERVNKGLVYWGAFRVDRVEQFKRYLATDRYPVTISTSLRAAKKFQELCPNAEVYGPAKDLYGFVGSYESTIYIEDEDSNTMYCSPANRFYEAVSYNLPLFVDRDAVNTLKTAGFKPELVVDSDKDIEQLLPNLKPDDYEIKDDLKFQFFKAMQP
jgi:hypothetical protein